jgi:TolA-binding protein
VRGFVAAAAVAALAGSAAAGDILVLSDGRTFPANRGDPPGPADFASSSLAVVDENLDGVTYRIEGVPTKQTMQRALLKRVVHDPAAVPADLADGMALAARGKFDEARAKFSVVAKSATAPAWAQAEGAYRRAESYVAAGDLPAAERALGAFAAERPKSKFVVEAKRLRARVLAETGRDDDARAEYDSLAQLAGATDDEQLDARFFAVWTSARAAARAGDAARVAAAAKTFDELRSNAPGRPFAARCDVAKAALTARDADSLARLVADSEDPFVLAVGGTLAAEPLHRRGKEKQNRAALEEAQERFLRVTLLYADAEGAADFVAQALFRAGEIFLLLAPEDAEAKLRARREWEELVRRFPRTEWADRAKAGLAELR